MLLDFNLGDLWPVPLPHFPICKDGASHLGCNIEEIGTNCFS